MVAGGGYDKMRVGSLIETSNEYKLAEIALNEYIYNEDMSLLEAYAEGDIGFLLEATDEEKRLGLSKREIKRRRKLELIPQELSRRGVGNLYNSTTGPDLEDNLYPNLDPESLKRKPDEKNKNYGRQIGINRENKYNIESYANKKYGLWRDMYVSRSEYNLENLKQKGIPVKNYKQIHKVFGNSSLDIEFLRFGGNLNIHRVNMELEQKGYKPVTIEDLRSPNFVLHKDSDSDTPKQPTTPPSSKPKEQAKEIAQVVKNEEPPKPQQPISQPKSEQPLSQQEKVETMKKMQQKTQKVLDTSEHQPKSVLARMVSSLQHLYREWLDKKNQAKANGQDVGFFSNILRIILNCIDKLMWKIRNWSDGRKSKHYNSK